MYTYITPSLENDFLLGVRHPFDVPLTSKYDASTQIIRPGYL